MSQAAYSTIVEELLNKTKEEINRLLPVNIMLIGKTGVGKSTLINNIFRENLAETGIGQPVTKHLRRITKEGVPITLYDTRGLELDQEIQSQIREEINYKIHELYTGKDEKDYIHAIWYCINASSNRIEEYEIDMINQLSEKAPIFLVLTQSFGISAEEFKKSLENMNLDVKGIQLVLAEPYKIHADYTIPPYGLKELVGRTYEVLPQSVKKAFNNAQKVDIDKKVKEAQSWSVGYIGTSFGAGFTPIPFADAAVLVPIQVGMLAHITAIFGVSMDRALLTSLIGSIGGTSGATFLGRYIVANVLKLVPGVGTALGGFISGATASIITTALAFAYIQVMAMVAHREYEGKRIENEELALILKNLYEQELTKKK
ncbi:YcjF family protein [Jeotgalibacillus soli]|uniref:GTP-binding protein n=1 Tax=Jeotgalibacillus soli TaxID=889306 RepID=A0A0C2RRA9_9BACL|nr:GTPase [Jeotgalibacillus soli]KIL44294.1 GTP-binding protein [Jeotgalibacillus soli]